MVMFFITLNLVSYLYIYAVYELYWEFIESIQRQVSYRARPKLDDMESFIGGDAYVYEQRQGTRLHSSCGHTETWNGCNTIFYYYY